MPVVEKNEEIYKYLVKKKKPERYEKKKVWAFLYNKNELKEIYKKWISLRKAAEDYEFRNPNIPEALSEGAFCLAMNEKTGTKERYFRIKTTSADCFDNETKELVQIKAGSIENDCSSFGPKSYWDKIYYLDFYKAGNFDGAFDIYEIETELILETIVNNKKNETVKDQMIQGRRPRFSIRKKIINKLNLSPIVYSFDLFSS